MVTLPMRRKTHQPLEVVRAGDLIADNRLEPGGLDLLEHEAIARGVAEIAWTAEAPVNIALFGPWGSGKSSVYSMIEQHLDRIAPHKVAVARYDAWKYGGRELKRNFIDSLSDSLGLGDKLEFSEGLENDQEKSELRTWAWFKDNWASLGFGVFLAAVVAALWVLVQAGSTWLFTDDPFKATAKILVTQAGTVFGLALVATLVGPKVFEGAVVITKTSAPEDADQFAKRFKELVDEALKGKPERLVVFIDELDRCDPKDVVATLIDLKTFLDQENCVFIVAADREVIELALRKVPQAKPLREDEPYYATPGAFLDKIFQHQLALPPLRARALTQFAHDLVDTHAGIWQEMRDHDQDGQDTFDRAIFALVPVHVRSPRRVKVLLNNFATNARIAGSRGIEWIDRAHEVAVLTVLQTEFPAVAEDLRRVPRLLVYLRGEEETASDEVRDVVAKYAPETGARVMRNGAGVGDDPANVEEVGATTETPAGELLSDDRSQAGARERQVASETLQRHLANYLAKVAAAGIRDPRPDLLYLQAAAGREDLPAPHLGDVIDFATDTAPDTVVAAFDGYESATLAVAIRLLVNEGDSAHGPGRQFAYESGCRLIQVLDPGDHTAVTTNVGPSLLAAATSGSLSYGSLPGALLIACWADAPEVANDILRLAGGPGAPEDILNILTVALPYLEEPQRVLLVGMLADQFAGHPAPLMSALEAVPVGDAVVIWKGVAAQVLGALNELEVPEAEPALAPVGASAATRAGAAVAAPEDVVSTGAGVALLVDLINVVHERRNDEPLLSSVIETFQSADAVKPFHAWVNESADQLVGTMSSRARRARHALLGLSQYPDADVETWSQLLPEPVAGDFGGDSDDDIAIAADDLLGTLLAGYVSAGADELATLSELVPKVDRWASFSEDDIASDVELTLANIGWSGAAEEDNAGELLWARKIALHDTVVPLASGNDARLLAAFASDLADVPDHIQLTTFATEHWVDMCVRLPKGVAQDLSDRLDAYTPSNAELGAVLTMMLAVRGVFGGPAPSAENLTRLPATEQTTALTDAWLALYPSIEEVRGVLAALPFTTAAIRKYCDALPTRDRTQIWLSLLEDDAANGLLIAAGAGGVGQHAVAHVHNLMRAATREPERSRFVELLRLAKPAADDLAAVKKASGELGLKLLDKGTAGDLRTAAALVLWAGGPGYGQKEPLKQEFSSVHATHSKALAQRTVTALKAAGLLVEPRKSFLDTLRGR